MTPETKSKLECLLQALWPQGFRCEKCGATTAPFLKRRPQGWTVECRLCSSQYSLCSQRVRTIMRCHGVVEIFRDVCQVYGVSLEELLDKTSRRDIVIRARHSAAHLVSVYLVEQEICEVFRFRSHRDLRQMLAKPKWQCDLWQVALEARRKDREKYERKRARNRARRETQVEAVASGRQNTSANGGG